MVRVLGKRPRANFAERVALVVILVLCVVFHAWNLLPTPWFFSDEGTYMYRAMYLQDAGTAYPPGNAPGFTLVHDHPFGGWALLALIFSLFAPLLPNLGPPAYAYIFLGRATMVALATLDALLLYLIGRRAANRWVGLAGASLMAVAPLSVTWGREVLLDNIMAFWFLLSLHAALWGRARGVRWAPILSGALMAVAIITKIPALFLIPVPLLVHVLGIPRTSAGASSSRARFLRSVPLWSMALVAVVMIWPLYAVAHGEFGRLTGGLLWIENRNEGYSFLDLMARVARRDPVLLALGLAGIGYGFLRVRRGHLLLALPALLYLLFLWWVRVRWAYYVAPLAPFFALSAALPVGDLAYRLQLRLQARPLARALPAILVAALLVVSALPSADLNRRDDNSAGLAAAQWVIDRAEPFSLVLTNAIYQGSIQRARPDLWVLYWMDSDFNALTEAFMKRTPPPQVSIYGPRGRAYAGTAMASHAYLNLPGGQYLVTLSYPGGQNSVAVDLTEDTLVIPRPAPRFVPEVLTRPSPGFLHSLQVVDPLSMRVYFISDNTACCAGWAGALFNALHDSESVKVFEGGSKNSTFHLTLPPALYSVSLDAKQGSTKWLLPLGDAPTVHLVPGQDVLAPAEAPRLDARGPMNVTLAFQDMEGKPIPYGWLKVRVLTDLARFPNPYGDAGVVFADGVRGMGPGVPGST